MVGDGEDLPMVEIVSDSGDDPGEDAVGEPARPWAGHEVVRTLAAVVTAAAVVWGAAALHGSRAANDRMACISELQMSMFIPGDLGRDDASDQREILNMAVEECDFTVIPEFLENVDG